MIQRVNWDKYNNTSYSKDKSGFQVCMDNSLFPIIHSMHTCDNRIFFKPQMETHLALLNLSRINPKKYLKITILFELVPIFLEYRYLESAEQAIKILKNETRAISKLEDFEHIDIDLDLQFEFFIGHEKAHNQYRDNAIPKNDAIEKVNEIIKLYTKPQNLLQYFFFPKIKRMFQSETVIEELSCDRNSILYFFREIPNNQMISIICQLSQLLYMLQLHNDLEELIGFHIRKGFSKHLSRFFFDVVRGVNIVQAILEKNEQISEDMDVDGEYIRNLIHNNADSYNQINNQLISLWQSDMGIFASIVGNHPDTKNHGELDSLTNDFDAIAQIIVNKIFTHGYNTKC